MNMLDTIIPKSDQLNSDDLLGGPITITIRDVKIVAGEQPCSIYFEGDEGKPYRPSKGMRRVIVQGWGADARDYVGRGMTLFRDPNVTYGGMAVGGIQISHMSHLPKGKEMVCALTVRRGQKAILKVQPLRANVAPVQPPADPPPAEGRKETKPAEPEQAPPAPPPIDWEAELAGIEANLGRADSREKVSAVQGGKRMGQLIAKAPDDIQSRAHDMVADAFRRIAAAAQVAPASEADADNPIPAMD